MGGIGLLLGLLLFRFQLDLQIDPDLFARLAAGKLIWESGAIPKTDVFSFMETKPLWIDHEWLSGLSFYWIYTFSGELGLFLIKVVFSAVTFFFLFEAQRTIDRESPFGVRVFWLALLGVFIPLVWHTTVRSQIFTYFFIALELLVLAKHSCGTTDRVLFPLALIMPVWVNAHGGFVVGLGFLAIYGVCSFLTRRRSGPIFLTLAACVLLTLLNPYGVEYWRYIVSAVSMKRPLIKEWNSVSPISAAGFPLVLVIAVIAAGGRRVRSMRLEALALLTISIFFAFRHFRFVPLPLMVASVYFTPAFSQIAERARPIVQYIYGEMLIISLVLILSVFGYLSFFSNLAADGPFQLDFRLFPERAVNWLARERGGGTVLSSYRHGNYVLWELYPRFKVAIDGRYEEVYSEEIFQTAYRALNPAIEGHLEALRKISPDFIVVDARTVDLRAGYGAGYSLVFDDSPYFVYERTSDHH